MRTSSWSASHLNSCKSDNNRSTLLLSRSPLLQHRSNLKLPLQLQQLLLLVVVVPVLLLSSPT